MISVNGREAEWNQGLTISRLLERMGYGLMRITVTVNGVFVPEDDYGSCAVPDGADVKAIHLHHGG